MVSFVFRSLTVYFHQCLDCWFLVWCIGSQLKYYNVSWNMRTFSGNQIHSADKDIQIHSFSRKNRLDIFQLEAGIHLYDDMKVDCKNKSFCIDAHILDTYTVDDNFFQYIRLHNDMKDPKNELAVLGKLIPVMIKFKQEEQSIQEKVFPLLSFSLIFYAIH